MHEIGFPGAPADVDALMQNFAQQNRARRDVSTEKMRPCRHCMNDSETAERVSRKYSVGLGSIRFVD